MTSTSDWLHSNQSNPSTANEAETPYTTTMASNFFSSGRVSDPNMETTTMSSINNPTLMGQAQAGPTLARTSKPARKRTRASRSTPTTLLRTDTANFRAMVQQFTGGPSNNFNLQVPGPQVLYGQSYGLHVPMGQLQQPVLSPLQYSIPSNNNNNNSNVMFMQRTMGESFNTNSNIDGRNINVNMSSNGSGHGSSSSENKSNNSLHY